MKTIFNKIYLVIIFTCLFPKIHSQQWLWAKTFSVPSFSYILGVQSSVGSNGNFYISCFQWDQNEGLPAGSCLIKFDVNGNEIQRKLFADHLRIYRLLNDHQGNILVCGDFRGKITISGNTFQSAGKTDGFVMNMDPNFNLIWFKQVPGPGEESVNDAFVNEAGDLYLTGHFSNAASIDGNLLSTIGKSNTFILKCSDSGHLLFSFTANIVDSGLYNSGSGIRSDGAGNIYLYGCYNQIKFDTSSLIDYSPYNPQYFAKFNSGGQLLFLKPLATSTDKFRSMLISKSGIYFTGDGGWTTGGWSKTRKYNHDGTVAWTKHHSGFYYSYASHKILENEAGFYAVGYEINPNVPNWISSYSLVLSNFDAFGNENFNKVSCKGYGSCLDINRTDAGEYLITGHTPDTVQLGNQTLYKKDGYFFIAKFNNQLITNLPSEKPFLLREFNISPNPSRGQFIIQREEQSQRGTTYVYELLGNCILTRESSSSLTETLDLSDKPKGIYFVEIIFPDTRIRKKIILH